MLDSEDAFGWRRARPTKPYVLPSSILRVPASGLRATVIFLQSAGQNESGVMWYGTKDNHGNGNVLYVVAPRQRMSWGNYHISAEALGAVVHGLRDGWRPLAQTHSHPGSFVEHSLYDDQMISSHNILSLVFPSYGRGSTRFPIGIGVHEFQHNYWYLLSDEYAARRVVVTEGDCLSEDLR
jgi:hypothetical protein